MDIDKIKSFLYSSDVKNQRLGVNLAINVLGWSMFEILKDVIDNMRLHEVMEEYEDNYSETILSFLNIDIYFEPFALAKYPHVLIGIASGDHHFQEFKFFLEEIPAWHIHEFELFLVKFYKSYTNC